MALTWYKNLEDLLIKTHGKKKGANLTKKYSKAFSAGYIDVYDIKTALSDINQIESLSDVNPLAISIYCSDSKDTPLHLRLFQWKNPIALSDILPMLENFDLKTLSEIPNKININGDITWISDFAVRYFYGDLNLDPVRELFEDAFKNIYMGKAENDGFNKLVLAASLSWKEIIILRAYTKYLKQIRFRFSEAYIEKALVKNAVIAKSLVQLFLTLHKPSKQKLEQREKNVRTILDTIRENLDNVFSLDEDTILRRILAIIMATVRTNYFQEVNGDLKPYISFKFASEKIPELPLPIPLYEIFVYSPIFEAIHLRSAKVARGGIRWSDRLEDFRTEVLGLMKAQKVKNALIVPSGAKGGFVLKNVPLQISREELLEKVVQCYQFFIHGLLDLTDNIVEKKIIRPNQVVCFDDEDPYLVVAADKGTATFSDIANSISKQYGFWLGDAFASGGSTGYDHKKMGITARGAWESIKRHFREFDIDINISDITVVGIGDMSGDVFGNGMIYSKHIKLIAAFDHRNIFIDPNPIPEISYYERVRLFNLPISSWENYNTSLISKGGGVYKRTSKSILITPQMKKVLAIEDNTLTPNELIKAILKAPVDLLFNGGIGTYVKGSIENDADVGDRTNDYSRVNGNELRCRVVAEGGNLGFTQLSRIEYALNGGLINTDFIDNSAGVDCSDHEVNLKILLDNEVRNGRLSEKRRNALLLSFTEEVADIVLKDNYYQALVMSFSFFDAQKNIGLHTNYIRDLESDHLLDRRVEYLPDEKRLVERKTQGLGLTRPELAVLLAYTKINIKNEILKSNLYTDPYINNIVTTAFPKSIRKKYESAMREHPLNRDIIATQLSNRVVNEMGITYVYRLEMETGATVSEIIHAHAIASHIFETRRIQKIVQALDFKIPMSEQYEILYNIRRLINLATRWFLLGTHMHGETAVLIEHYAKRIKQLQKITPELMAGNTKEYMELLTNRFLKVGLSEETARLIATYRAIYTSLNIIDVATTNNFDLIKTAKVYFAAGERINLVWFRDQIANDAREGHWNALARLTLRDELDITQRTLTVVIMNKDKKELDPERLIERWQNDNRRALQRWDSLLSLLHGSTNVEYSMFFIAIRELLGLISNSQ